MTEEKNQGEPAGFRVSGGSNVRLSGNVSIGRPMLSAENVKNLEVSDNVSVAPPANTAQAKQEPRPLKMLTVKIVSTVVATIFATWLMVYVFGWTI